jgi:hypothetical protein
MTFKQPAPASLLLESVDHVSLSEATYFLCYRSEDHNI